MGCYLVDLCGQPVDRMNRHQRRRICEAGEARLARRLRKLRPMIIITVVRSVGSNVRRAEAAARWSSLHLELPYPGRWHRARVIFRQKLTPLLRRVLRSNQTDLGTSRWTNIKEWETPAHQAGGLLNYGADFFVAS